MEIEKRDDKKKKKKWLGIFGIIALISLAISAIAVLVIYGSVNTIVPVSQSIIPNIVTNTSEITAGSNSTIDTAIYNSNQERDILVNYTGEILPLNLGNNLESVSLINATEWVPCTLDSPAQTFFCPLETIAAGVNASVLFIFTYDPGAVGLFNQTVYINVV